ncbi:neuronal membrane glycoprotein M6-b isoform X3 [Ursus maritimus]|uniref:Neuronal membrane glycoprotein M6-b isoform X3 n=1 Tax=Ursus maritimus TaxID=29073 RepID=A0A8M1G681_URSMA|nr:neuronal membrane glycoprotein M6-b isoform X3 [Ursus maritimus]
MLALPRPRALGGELRFCVPLAAHGTGRGWVWKDDKRASAPDRADFCPARERGPSRSRKKGPGCCRAGRGACPECPVSPPQPSAAWEGSRDMAQPHALPAEAENVFSSPHGECHFSGSRPPSHRIQLMQYVIYGIASFFFLYGIILLAEGFYTTSAVKELHGEFKTTACGRCISGMFVFLTYVLGVAWLGVFGFSAVPVFMFYNIWSTCEVIKSPQTNGTAAVEQICVDIRQYGIIPWNAFPGKICGSALENICNTNEFYMSYHLFIVACAGAGATVIALLIYMMATTYNYAVLKFKSREDCCTKF